MRRVSWRLSDTETADAGQYDSGDMFSPDY